MFFHKLLCMVGLHAPFKQFSYRPLGFLGDHRVICWKCRVCYRDLGTTKAYDSENPEEV